MKPLGVTLFALLFLSVLGKETSAEDSRDERDNETVQIRIPQGLLLGMKKASTHGRTFYSFKGIPFSQPPIQKLRFKDPQIWQEWSGVREAFDQPSPCPQLSFTRKMYGNEDCLYLNVFTPKLPANTTNDAFLPIMVYIHGGGYFQGSADLYGAENFMDEDVVVVVMQYRLGIFGFLSTEDSVIPGNFGLKDQNMALRWVQHNARYFGGDPLKVTLFGQSAGASCVLQHVVSPASVGLFSNVIIQSGSSAIYEGKDFRKVAFGIGELLHCGKDIASRDLLRCLQEVEPMQLITKLFHFYTWETSPNTMAPRIDGWFLPAEVPRLLKDGKYNDVNIMIGTTSDEGAFFSNYLGNFPDAVTDLQSRMPVNFPSALSIDEEGAWDICLKILNFYFGKPELDVNNTEKIIDMFGYRHFNMFSDVASTAHLQNHKNGKLYLYEYSHVGQYNYPKHIIGIESFGNYSNHGDELFLLFKVKGTGPLDLKEDRKLRDNMVKTWVNFAKYGNPTPDDSLGFTWKPATNSSLRHLMLQTNPVMMDDQGIEEREFWTSLPLKENFILYPEKFKVEEDESIIDNLWDYISVW
ncbi:esterase E4-like [Oratosquilla oratoria]|uniref:esterase E4-like n=1 Tax=Oratosquilla oratoria TaxID=337810 RepID=UPI003F774DDF